MLRNCLSSNFALDYVKNIVLLRKALFAPQILIMHYQYYCIFCKIYPQLTWRAKARVQNEIQSKYLIVLYMVKEFFFFFTWLGPNIEKYRKWESSSTRGVPDSIGLLICLAKVTAHCTYIVPLYYFSVILIYGSLGRYNNLSP